VAGGLVVTGIDPVDVLADVDTTTTGTTNSTSGTTSSDRVQQFVADITAEINAGVTVNGFGLELNNTAKTAGTVTVVNDGAIVVDDPTATGLYALSVFADGAIDYSGSGDLRSASNTNGGLLLHTAQGSVTVTMTGGQIGAAEAPTATGIAILSDNPTDQNVSVVAETIYAIATGINVMVEEGSSNIGITANGAISAQSGIEARIGNSAGGGGSSAEGDIDIITYAAITAVSEGIHASTNKNSTGDIFIETNAAITVSAGIGISASAPNGDVSISVAADVDATGARAIDVRAGGMASVLVFDGTVAAHGAGLAAIAVSGDSSSVFVFDGATVTGDVGIAAFAETNDITVSGTVEGTGGTAVLFDASSADNIFELETTGRVIGNVIGSGTDTLILCGGDLPAGSFDLDQIVSGFVELDKEDDTTWTVTGTLVVDTFVDEGKLLLSNATLGNTTVGTGFTFESALLGGIGTVGALTVGAFGVIAPGNGILHSGSVTFDADATFLAHGLLAVTGTVDLGGATLMVSAPLGVGVGNSFVIISNDGGDAVTGTFAGLAEGATVAGDGGTFTVHYGGGDGNDVTLTINSLSGLIVTGTGPVNVAAVSNVTTKDTENFFTNAISTAASQIFIDDVTAVIDTGVTVNGWGLQIASEKPGGSVFVANHGAVVLDDPGATFQSALTIVGNGGLAGYAGDGDVRNEVDDIIFSDGLFIFNTGDVSAEISGGVINGNRALTLFAVGGAVTLDMTGGQLGTLADPAARIGVEVTSVNPDHEDINLTTAKIWAGIGIDVLLTSGDGSITVTANGAISADLGSGISTTFSAVSKYGSAAGSTGNTSITTNATIDAAGNAIDAFVGSPGAKGGGNGGEIGNIGITTNAAITAGGFGISAVIAEAATGNITITANASISAASAGISAIIDGTSSGGGGKGGGGCGCGGSGSTGGPGDIHITANASVESIGASAIYAENNRGDMAVEIGGGVISGTTGLDLHTVAGAVTVDMKAGQIGTSGAPVVDGIFIEADELSNQDISVTAQAIHATDTGIDVTVIHGTSDIAITANGAITADFGISVDRGTGKGGMGPPNSDGDTAVTTNAAITSVFGGIVVDTDANSKGSVEITTNAAITVSSFGEGILVRGHDGDITITVNGSVETAEGDAIEAGTTGSVLITINGDVVSHGVGNFGVDAGGTLLTLEIGALGSVSGETGIFANGGTNSLVIAGAVEGTDGTAIEFNSFSANNILEMETTGTLNGNVIGSGSDTLILCGGANDAASFDLDQIASGFAQIAKEEDSTWTVTGTLTVNTAVDEGKLVLANATIGDTVVGGIFTIDSATLAGSGAVGTLTVSDKGILGPGTSAGFIHSGNVTFETGATFAVELGGTNAGTQYDRLDVTGTVDLGDATLTVAEIGGYHAAAGASFIIVANDDTDVVTGTFNGLAEGAHFTVSDVVYAISYQGGTGNDVVLTVLNHAPTDIALSPASVPENSANGTVVGALSDTDPGDTAAFTLLDNAGGRFAISGANLVVANGSLLNFEQNTSHSVTVRATDSGGLTFDKAITVTLTNVNEAPTNIALSHASIAENSGNGTVVGTLSGIDQDAGDTAAFTLLNNAGGRFAISGSNLVVADGSLLNFERGASHAVTVRVTDSGGLTFDKLLVIAVTDVPESLHWMASVPIGPHPAGWLPSGAADFNSDGTSDLAWYNASNGDLEIWKISAGQWAGSVDIGSHPAGWQPAGFADFNNDGTSDALWYNPTTNNLDLWKIADGHWAGSVNIGSHPAGWQPAGAGDFNDDGTSDILWYNPTTGNAEIWKIQDGAWAGSVNVGPHPLGWRPSVVGDFNGDGTDDIGWYNATTGNFEIWKIVNGQWAGSVDIGLHPLGWQPLGAGDFNEDGVADVTWYNPTTNNVEVWLISDGHWAGSVNVGSHPGGSVAVGVGDFDHNGVSDVMWRNSDNSIDTWLLAYS
jgi:fibronectin-binding autotransporter adhesin